MSFLINILQNLLNSIFKSKYSEDKIENKLEENDVIINIDKEVRDSIIIINKENDNIFSPQIKEFNMITNKQFSSLFPKAKINFSDTLNKEFEKNNINTLERVSCFLAQCGHESTEFTVFIENLNYSDTRLLQVFPKYFKTIEEAKNYARNPQAIANKVYANRMGNGPEESGDGWKYRGRGLIQLTGKNNYNAFAKFCIKSLDETISYCETENGIVRSAIWFWIINNCNSFADDNNFLGLTKKINGGTVGLKERKDLYDKVKLVIAENFKV